MSEALAVQERHLSIPQCALFSPCELTIAANCSESEFSRIVAAVTALDKAEKLWVADFSLFGIQHFGKEKGLKLAREASGFTKAYLYRASLVAIAFPPERRCGNYSFNHYRSVMCFPREWVYGFLERNASKNISSNSLRALAESEWGGNPVSKAEKPKNTSVRIPAELFARLRQYSDKAHIHTHIANILETWIKLHPEVPKPVIAEPVKRPTYAARRKQQIADGAKPIMKKQKKQKKLRIAWTECKPDEFVDSEDGAKQTRYKNKPPAKFFSEADAIAAETEHFEAKGYHEQVKKCDVCCGGNARRECWHVYHIYRTAQEEKQ